jgi:hypothetical protein
LASTQSIQPLQKHREKTLFSEVGLFPGEGKEIDTAFSPGDFPQEYFAAIGS